MSWCQLHVSSLTYRHRKTDGNNKTLIKQSKSNEERQTEGVSDRWTGTGVSVWESNICRLKTLTLLKCLCFEKLRQRLRQSRTDSWRVTQSIMSLSGESRRVGEPGHVQAASYTC